MEGEINNFVLVWILVIASLCYCHIILHLIPAGGTKRLLAVLPVVCLFFILPLSLTTISLGGLTSFFVAWLCNFKLLLFAFGRGPLSTSPPNKPLSLANFIAIACLPIKILNEPPSKTSEKGLRSPLNYVIKCLLIIVAFLPLLPGYEWKELVHPMVLSVMYIVHVYVGLEVSLAAAGALARALIGVGLEPQFKEPYFSTSLQDFWGRRWNLMVTNILRPTVYLPVRSISSHVIGRNLAPLPASLSCFIVSALMHELIFYYIGRKEPTWMVSSFFLLHGVGVALEIAVKKAFAGKIQLPGIVSRALTMGFILSTTLWLFLPALLWCDAEDKWRGEAMAIMNFVKHADRAFSRFSSVLLLSR